MEDLDSRIHDFRRGAALTSALAIALRFLALWCLLWGIGVLALRAGFGAQRGGLLWGLAGLIPAAALALILGFRGRPSRRSVLSLLDLHSGGGGLMMASGEVEIGDWQSALGDARALKVRGRYPWSLLAVAAGFAAAAFLMPVVPVGLDTERPLAIGEEIAELTERVAALEQEGLLEEYQAERFESELEVLEDQASGDDPAATWEALDHLREMTDRDAAEVAEAALAEGEQLAAAAAVAEALSDGGDGAMEHLAAEAMAELSALTQRAAGGKLLDGALAAELISASGDDAPGTQMDLGRLLEAIGRGKGSLGEKIDRLYAAGLIDLETLLAAKRSLAGGDLEALASYLEDHGLEAAGGYCRGSGLGSGRPGRGGVSRGRGDAPMTWKDPSSPDGAKWRQQVLDPAALAALHQSRLLGLTAADPSALDPGAPAASGTAIDPAAAAGGGAAYTHTLLPRHRGAVKRYFDRQVVDSPAKAEDTERSPGR